MTEADRMVELLRYASQAKVAKALGVSKSATNNWSKGLDVSPFRLRQVEDLLRPQRAGETDPTNGELLTEMRAIRRLLQRQTTTALAPVPVSHEFVVAVVDGLRDVLAQREAARPAAGSRRPARGGGRRPKVAPPEGAAR